MEKISVPEWVPSHVIQIANVITESVGGQPPEMLDLLCRLITDERMKGAWQDLQKHKRENYVRTPSQFYETELPDAVRSWAGMRTAWQERATEYRELGDEATARQYENFAALAETRQESCSVEKLTEADRHGIVLALIFALAVGLYRAGLEMVARSNLERQIESLRTSGQADAADVLDRHARMPDNARFLVARKRGDQRIHAFVRGMAKELCTVFGQDMPGVIATFTNVAFDRSDYDRDRVRALLKTRP
jgi:hypothetical protein